MYDVMNSINWKQIAEKGPNRPKGWTPNTDYWLDELRKPWEGLDDETKEPAQKKLFIREFSQSLERNTNGSETY